MRRRTRQNPLATARDLGTYSIADIGGGVLQVTVGGIVAGTYTPGTASWSGTTGKPAWTDSFCTADGSTTAADITAWLAVPFNGWKRLVGSATLSDAAIIIPSNTWLDATGATITQPPGTNKRMIQNTAVTPLRTTGGTAVVVAGDNTVSGLTGASFTSADIGRNLAVGFLDSTHYGNNVYGIITAINSSTSVEIDPPPLVTETGGVARIYGRDKNIHIRGGVWDHGTNDGAVNGNFIHLRRIDGGSVRQVECFSTAGAAYAISPGDVTDFTVERPRGSVFSALVQFAGPGKNIKLFDVEGVSHDDLTAFTTTDYGPWNDCHGSYDDITIDGVTGDPDEKRMVLIGGSCLTPLDGDPAMPDGHSYNNVKIRNVNNTGAGISAGIQTWVQSDDAGARIDNLTIENANCVVRLQHNAHGKVTLKNVTGDVTVSSMPSPYPCTASVVDDLTLDNCTGFLDTNDTRTTITKLTARGGSIPYLWLACDAVGTVVMDGVTFLNRLFRVGNGCAVDTLTFAHCTGTTDYSAGIGRIESGSVVGEINVHDSPVSSTATTNGALVHALSGSTLGTMRVARSTITDMGDVLLNASSGQVKLFLTDLSVVGCDRIAEGAGGADVKYGNVYFDGGYSPFYGNGPMRLSGSGFSLSASARTAVGGYDLTVPGAAVVHVIDPNLRTDVDLLTKALGDTAYNTNVGLACGVGPVISDGTHWKHMYTGTATP